MSTLIIPRYKLLMTYDIRPDMYDPYYRYFMGEFIPALQQAGLYMLSAWHTQYGDYPMRQIEFVSEELETIQNFFESDHWEQLEARFKSYTLRYGRKLVRYRDGFQF